MVKLSKEVLLTSGEQYSPLRKVISTGNSNFLVLGGTRNNEESNTDIVLLNMDSSLNVIWEKHFQTEGKYLERICYTLNNRNNLAIAGTLYSGRPARTFSIIF